jgi:hypothetical protein
MRVALLTILALVAIFASGYINSANPAVCVALYMLAIACLIGIGIITDKKETKP